MKLLLIIATLIFSFVLACGDPSATSTATPVPGATHTPTATPTATRVPGTTQTPTTATPTPTPGASPSIGQLKYLLIDRFGFFFCDPDYYPVARNNEEQRAIEEFPKIRQNGQEFQAIVEHLDFRKVTDFSKEQQLAVYREHKKLNALQLQGSAPDYTFQIRTGDESKGFVITGVINAQGHITVQAQEAAILTCPICLSRDTLIETPYGPVPIQDLSPGKAVWTADPFGNRVQGVVKQIGSTPAPPGHTVIRLVLDDGRSLLASPNHPLPDGRTLADLSPGDKVNGARVVSLERLPYTNSHTYDILPSGETGFYWANGILVSSTLHNVLLPATSNLSSHLQQAFFWSPLPLRERIKPG